jgi:hypothetical protein
MRLDANTFDWRLTPHSIWSMPTIDERIGRLLRS